MGGKALLPEVPDLKRLSKAEYDVITREVTRLITSELGLYSSYIKLIPSYSNKAEFGDADYIIDESVLSKDWVERLSKAFKSSAVHHTENSNVWSFEYKKFQIDIIVVPPNLVPFAFSYFSYNDMGNLIGRVARSMGFKFGWNGLWIEVNEDNQKIGEVLVTDNWYNALDLLGFRAYDYGYGMNKLEDIFSFITNSHYFNKESFSIENGNHRDRTRDAKRVTYTQFLEHISKPEVKNRYTFSDKQPWVAKLRKMFPQAINEYQCIKEKYNFDKLKKLKFNGDIVKDLTGLEGKNLGDFMGEYKKSFKTVGAFDQFILASLPDTIAESIKNFVKVFEEKAEKEAKVDAKKP